MHPLGRTQVPPFLFARTGGETMTKAELYQKACMLPLLPGVYIIRDKADTIIYIGKAKRLRTRGQPVFPGGRAP